MSDFSAASTAQPNEELRHIYDLILNDQQPAAVEQLRAYIGQHPNDAEAWWLMANAVPDIPSARVALQSVLQIEPDHAQARELTSQLDAAEAEQNINLDPFDPEITETATAPIWLTELSQTVSGTIPASSPMPDWLTSVAGTGPLSLDEELGPPPEDLLNWFTAPTGEETETPTEVAPVTPSAGIPDWLQAAAPGDEPTPEALNPVDAVLAGWEAPPDDLLNETLTTDASGTAIPKQFCSLHGGTSLLLDTLRRAHSFAARNRIGAV